MCKISLLRHKYCKKLINSCIDYCENGNYKQTCAKYQTQNKKISIVNVKHFCEMCNQIKRNKRESEKYIKLFSSCKEVNIKNLFLPKQLYK